MGEKQDTPTLDEQASSGIARYFKLSGSRRVWLAAVAAAAAMTALFLLLLHGTQLKQVTIIVDGEAETVRTKQAQAGQLLAERSISFAEHDRFSMALDEALKHGDTLRIDTTVPVAVRADGRESIYYTIGRDVASALKDLAIGLGPEDLVHPPLGTDLAEVESISVVRVKRQIEEVSERVPFQVVRQNDAKLLKGREEIVQEGREGQLVKTLEKVYHDGVLVAQDVLDETVASASVNRIIAVGTQNPVVTLSASSPDIQEVTKGGVTFGVKQILNNVTLTAYAAGPKHTGKDEDHPAYGITFTGTRVEEGRTVAVDPKVIPLGWWIYIEGIGFRRAEDIGSGVKGNWVDVYFENDDYTRIFGLKRGQTVYIIGPVKPAAD